MCNKFILFRRAAKSEGKESNTSFLFFVFNVAFVGMEVASFYKPPFCRDLTFTYGELGRCGNFSLYSYTDYKPDVTVEG